MTPEEEIQRAGEAQSILRNQLFKEAVKEVREAIITGIERSAFTDEKTREKLSQQLVSLTAVVNKLQSHMESGKLAEETIRRQTMGERIKKAVNW
jgi:hypothetical protein